MLIFLPYMNTNLLKSKRHYLIVFPIFLMIWIWFICFFVEVENYLRPKDFYVSVKINLFIFRVGR